MRRPWEAGRELAGGPGPWPLVWLCHQLTGLSPSPGFGFSPKKLQAELQAHPAYSLGLSEAAQGSQRAGSRSWLCDVLRVPTGMIALVPLCRVCEPETSLPSWPRWSCKNKRSEWYPGVLRPVT